MLERQIRKPTVMALGLVMAICVASLTAGAQNFTIVGPGGGGAQFHPTISPHDANEVLVSCDMTGAYISHDGGRSWRMFNLRGVIQYFAFDPLQPRVIYAGNRNLWRSTDDGESWKLVWPKPSMVRGVLMDNDHAGESVIAAPSSMGEIIALAIDPADSHTLIAGSVKWAGNYNGDHASGYEGKPGIFLSKDDGSTWEKIRNLPGIPKNIWIDPHSNRNDRDLYLAEPGLVTVRYRGKWQDRPTPKPDAKSPDTDSHNDSISAGFSAQQGTTLYAKVGTSIYVSKDGGASWNASPLPGDDTQVHAIATSLNHPESAYASYNHLKIAGIEWTGVARTWDSGRTWSLVWKQDNDNLTPNVSGGWISDMLNVNWGFPSEALTVAEQNPDISYGTDFGRTVLTTDGGASWRVADSKKIPGGDWTSTGLDVTTTYGYLVDPFDANRRFIPTTDIGLFRSEDKGRSWTRSVVGAPEDWGSTTYWVTFDPAVRGKMWSAMSEAHDLPRAKMWRDESVTTYRGGICLSLDGGRTWKVSSAGMPETAPTHILLDPSSPAGKRTLWASAMGRGVYKSTDDGVSWTLKNQGIVQNEPLAWRLARAEDGTLYVIITRRSDDGTIGTNGDGAVYKSTDGAESWTAVKLPNGVNGPNGLAIDPREPNRIYLAAWARATGGHGLGGGIFLSQDGGKTWKNVLERDQHVYDVTIDPRDASNLYASGFESSAWRSTDRGEQWARIPGYNFKWGHRVMPDLEDPRMVYISTFGGGVWHGPVSGDKRRPDIATPELEPGR